MIKKCPKCGSIRIVEAPSGDMSICLACESLFNTINGKSKQTVFDRITQSEETLAKKLVYCLNSSSFRVIDSAGRLLAYENEVWGSTILPGSFWTEYEQAIAATVAKLKEVEK